MIKPCSSEKRLPLCSEGLSVFSKQNIKPQKMLGPQPGSVKRQGITFGKPLMDFCHVPDMESVNARQIQRHVEPPSVLTCGKERISEGRFGTNRGVVVVN